MFLILSQQGKGWKSLLAARMGEETSIPVCSMLITVFTLIPLYPVFLSYSVYSSNESESLVVFIYIVDVCCVLDIDGENIFAQIS